MNKPASCARFHGLIFALGLSTLPPSPPAVAADPCCTVVSINKAAGTVTLRDNKTGKLETARVSDPTTLAGLTIGQPTDHLVQRYCSISTFEPCLDQERTHNCQPCPSGH
jgi:hypothetical protein